MPVGTFSAELRPRREKKPKPERVPKPKPEPKPQPRPEPKPEPKPVETPVIQYDPVASAGRFTIDLVARNQEIALDFLCAMNQNLSDALVENGLSMYNRSQADLAALVSCKKKLDRHFFNGSSQVWKSPVEPGGFTGLTLTVSPSGEQSHAFDLIFRCVTPGMAAGLSGADAVWVLADGLLGQEGDTYLGYMTDCLRRAHTSPDTPVFLLLSQLEGMGCYDSIGTLTRMPAKQLNRMTALAREKFSGLLAHPNPIFLLPVQIYGGLQCAGADPQGSPQMRINPEAICQHYRPEACQLPAMVSLQLLLQARGQAALPDGVRMTVEALVRDNLKKKTGNTAWSPMTLQTKEAL